MKIEQLIVQYLYSNKKVTLQDLGTFTISSDVTIPLDSEKDTVLPTDYIQFIFDRKAGVDEGLIDYIIANTRKIRPLATSDLESFIMLNKQFLNIGKPLILEGIGTLQKTQQGDISFVQANASHVTNEETPKVVTEKQKEKITFATPQKEKNVVDKSSILKIGIAAVLIIGIGAVLYYFINKNNNDVENNKVDTLAENKQIVTTDTSNATNIDSTKPIAQKNAMDSNSFYIIVNEYKDLAKAQKRFKQLVSYDRYTLEFFTKDSITYKVRMPFRLNVNDTLRVKDSIAKLLNPKAYVELP